MSLLNQPTRWWTPDMVVDRQAPITQRARRLYKQAEQALLSGRLDEAREKGERLKKDYPSFADGFFLLSLTYQHLRRETEALQLIEHAIALSPGSVHFLAQRSALSLRLGDFQKALQTAAQAFAQGVHDSWSQDILGVVLSTLDEHSQALPLFKKACEQQPDNPQFLYNLASAERVCGHMADAAEHLEAAIQLKPNFAKARWSLSTLKTATKKTNNQIALENQLADNRQPEMDRCYLQYALAKEYEDLGEWERAFTAYQRGADLRRPQCPYNREQYQQLFTSLQQTFTQKNSAPPPGEGGCVSREPIFIVGMPRTGTTLIETILGAHNDVYAAGELRQFPMAIAAMTKREAEPINSDVLLTPAQVKQSASLDFQALGEAYIDSTRPRTGKTTHFIDKLPLNFLYLGLIARALPHAKILHVTRNPMDTCWSNFKQLFGSQYPYSYNLEDTAHFYLLYRELMTHWHRVLPGHILDISYEQLIENQEAETRRLLTFCDLPWQSQCLDFHNSANAVATASSVQVRQPLYRSSVGKWRAFRSQMEPIERAMVSAGLIVQPQ